MKLQLRPRHLMAIDHQVLAALPAEACGLLTGTVQDGVAVVQDVWPALNILADHPGRFELDAATRIRVEKNCRATGQGVLGHWHSHPDGAAYPSATDRMAVYEPHLIWLIVATGAGAVTDRRAFLIPAEPDAALQEVAIV